MPISQIFSHSQEVHENSIVGVWGWVNLEISVSIGGFPVEYQTSRSVQHGTQSCAAGVAYNVAKALGTLGTPTRLTAIVGEDWIGRAVLDQMRASPNIEVYAVPVTESPQTVVLYDDVGQREVLFDQKDVPTVVYAEEALATMSQCRYAVVPNNNANRIVLRRAKEMGVPVVTDVHNITRLDDEHNLEFCAAADVLFLSDADIASEPEQWLREVGSEFGNAIIVLGMGEHGALVGLEQGTVLTHVPAVSTRPVRSTVGAGDALLSAFVDGLFRGYEPVVSLQRAVVFAGHKIGAVGGSEGFIDHNQLATLWGR